MHRITLARKLIRWFVSTLVIAALVFVSAGRLDLPMLWAYLAVCAAVLLAIVLATDPDLARERVRPGPGGLDRNMRLMAGPLLLGSMVLASADVGRLHWSDTVPPATKVTALVVFGLGMGLVAWAMAVNRFFSPVVRIQSERGHHLVAAGPYRLVRHPGYAGMIFGGPAGAVALGSWWAVLPAAIYAAVVLRRVMIEDRFLREHLEGYAAFSERVRYRLAPGIW